MLDWQEIPVAFLTGGLSSIVAAVAFYLSVKVYKEVESKFEGAKKEFVEDYFEELLKRAKQAQSVNLHDAALTFSVSAIIADLRSTSEELQSTRSDMDVIRKSNLPSDIMESMINLYQKRNKAVHASIEHDQLTESDSNESIQLARKIHKLTLSIKDA